MDLLLEVGIVQDELGKLEIEFSFEDGFLDSRGLINLLGILGYFFIRLNIFRFIYIFFTILRFGLSFFGLIAFIIFVKEFVFKYLLYFGALESIKLLIKFFFQSIEEFLRMRS